MLKTIWKTYMGVVELLFVYLPMAIAFSVLSVISAGFLIGKYAIAGSILYRMFH